MVKDRTVGYLHYANARYACWHIWNFFYMNCFVFSLRCNSKTIIKLSNNSFLWIIICSYDSYHTLGVLFRFGLKTFFRFLLLLASFQQTLFFLKFYTITEIIESFSSIITFITLVYFIG